jgi:small subunit ribosomal protein S4e
MVKNHLSRLNAPKSWPIRKKGIKFIKRPSCGAHSLRKCISLSLVLNILLKQTRTNKEVKKVLNERKVLVNGKVRKDPAFSVGIMDVITIPILKKSFRLLYDTKGKFTTLELKDTEAELLPLQIIDKTLLNKGRVQLNYFNGYTKIVEKDSYSTGDTLVLSVKDNSVKNHFEFKKGMKIYLTGGRQVGKVGQLEKVKDKNVIIKTKDNTFETAKRYAFAIGDLATSVEK